MVLLVPALIPIVIGIWLYLRWRRRHIPDGWAAYGRRGKVIVVNRPVTESAPSVKFEDRPNYVTIDCDGLEDAFAITLEYEMDADAVFAMENEEVRPDLEPTLSLHFQRSGDNWSGRRNYAGYRWYSRHYWPLAPGRHRARLELVEQDCIPVEGDPGGFDLALREACRVGYVVGHPAGRGHGVIGNGALRVISWQIERMNSTS